MRTYDLDVEHVQKEIEDRKMCGKFNIIFMT